MGSLHCWASGMNVGVKIVLAESEGPLGDVHEGLGIRFRSLVEAGTDLSGLEMVYSAWGVAVALVLGVCVR